MPRHAVVKEEEPLDGNNEVRIVAVKPDERSSRYTVEVEYRYRGDFRRGHLRAYALDPAGADLPEYGFPSARMERGAGTAELRLFPESSTKFAHSTRTIRVEMFDLLRQQVVVSDDIAYPIEWPRLPFFTTPEEAMAKDANTLYREAVAEIDYGSKDSLKNARIDLEALLTKDNRFVAAYPEMARYHMKTNWGPEGLRQAEQALSSGLAIDPNHANSYVLIGYVYANQGRFQEAEDAFTKANQIGTDNLWLWSNWGKLYLMQGRVPESVAMYKKAVAGVRPYNTYDRARKDAYKHLIDIFTIGNEVESADALHLKRIAEYGGEACFAYNYAEFRQRHFDDADLVLDYARRALEAGCRYEASVRKVIGTAYYSKWSAATAPDEKQSYLAQARLFFAEGPKLIYWLAQSDKTASIIKGVVSNGMSIDVADNDGITALAYAVKDDDLKAIERLIAMGGNPNATVGQEKMPLLAIAVLGNSKRSVEYLVSHGADVNAQVYGDASLLDIAEGMGYSDVADVLRHADGRRI